MLRVSILFAAAFLEEVARYSSDRSHLFPFNLLSPIGRHSIGDGYRSAGSDLRGRYAPALSVPIRVKKFASAAALLSSKPAQMKTTRLEAFSDGVLAIIITIMVLELKVPHAVELAALKPLLPVLLSYVLSFIYIGIYWNNHHHLFQATEQVSGGILWANLHLLFWLSLFPFTTGWMGENRSFPHSDGRVRVRSTDGGYSLSNSASTPSLPKRVEALFSRRPLAAIGKGNSLLRFISPLSRSRLSVHGSPVDCMWSPRCSG